MTRQQFATMKMSRTYARTAAVVEQTIQVVRAAQVSDGSLVAVWRGPTDPRFHLFRDCPRIVRPTKRVAVATHPNPIVPLCIACVSRFGDVLEATYPGVLM